MKIVVLDYGLGNVTSILNAFSKLKVDIRLSRDRTEICSSDGLIIPGVGSFAYGMEQLNKYDLVTLVREYFKEGKPILGICLGMQLLFDESYEFGITKGLGIVAGSVIKLPRDSTKNQKLPHVSWSSLNKKNINWDDTIFKGMSADFEAYFVHSYVAQPVEDTVLSVTSYYEHKFCSSIKSGNVYGCQFHPEKSSSNGLRILENFKNICEEKVDG